MELLSVPQRWLENFGVFGARSRLTKAAAGCRTKPTSRDRQRFIRPPSQGACNDSLVAQHLAKSAGMRRPGSGTASTQPQFEIALLKSFEPRSGHCLFAASAGTPDQSGAAGMW